MEDAPRCEAARKRSPSQTSEYKFEVMGWQSGAHRQSSTRDSTVVGKLGGVDEDGRLSADGDSPGGAPGVVCELAAHNLHAGI